MGWVVVALVALVGEGGWSGADGQDDGAVGSDGVALAVGAAASGELAVVFVAVVVAAVDAGVDLVGGARVDPFGDVVDLAEVLRQVAAGVVAASHEQFGGFTGRAGEEPRLAAHVDDDALGVDDDSADVAGECGAQDVVGVQWCAVGGLAVHAGEGVGVGDEVGEEVTGAVRGESGERIDGVAGEVGGGGEAGVGEHECHGAVVDDEVDQRGGCSGCVGVGVEVGVGAARHVDEGVVAALGAGAGEWLAGRVVAVLGAAGSGVGAELVLAEPPEDRLQFVVDERVAAGGVEVEFAADGGDVHVASGDLGVAGAVCAVEVGEHLEAGQGDDEVVVAVPLGELEQHGREVDEAVAHPRVAVDAGDRGCLGDTDAPTLESVGQAGDAVGGLRETASGGDVRVRRVARGTQVPLHRAVSVGHIQASLLDGGQRQRRLGLDPAAQQLQGPNPLVEFGIGGVEQLVGDVVDRAVAPPDRVAQRPQIHTTIMTKGCHRVAGSLPASRVTRRPSASAVAPEFALPSIRPRFGCMSWSTNDIPDLTGKIAVVTGANGGLGLASAKALAAKGAHVVMAARDQDKAVRARDEILAEHPSASLEIVELDLGSLASVEAAADRIAANHDRIDILMCNAGVMATPQGTTEDGFDTQFGINVLGHWALVGRLLPLVEATPGARIVTVSSTAQHSGRAVNPDDPHMREKYSAWGMYGQTKLAMRHVAVGLQRRFDQLGVDAKALSAQPGFTNSDLQSTTHSLGGAGIAGALSEKWVKVFGMSIDRGALSQLRAATDPGAPGGGFYGPLFATNGPPILKPLVRPGTDGAIDALWQVAERETGITIALG